MLRRRVEFAFERGPCDCERETEVDFTFHFPVFCTLFQTNVAKDKQEFSLCCILCRVLLRDAVRCVCVRSAEQSERSLILSRE